MAYSLNLLTSEQIHDPSALFKFAVGELQLGVKKSKHPFHLVSLCSSIDNMPDARTVVSRGIDENLTHVRIHSDQRSQKNSQLISNENVALLYYSSAQKLQVRLHGIAQVITQDNERKSFFDSSSLHSKLCYAFPIAPGSALKEQTKEAQFESITAANFDDYEAVAQTNFSVINVQILDADILWLSKSGHIRIMGERTNDTWNFEFVVA